MSRGLVVAAFAVALAACGGSSPTAPASLCNDFTPTATSVQSKAAPCSAGTTPVTLPSTQECTAALTQCNDADRQLLRNFLDCLNALPTCSLATATTFLDRINACTTPLGALTTACANATQVPR